MGEAEQGTEKGAVIPIPKVCKSETKRITPHRWGSLRIPQERECRSHIS